MFDKFKKSMCTCENWNALKYGIRKCWFCAVGRILYDRIVFITKQIVVEIEMSFWKSMEIAMFIIIPLFWLCVYPTSRSFLFFLLRLCCMNCIGISECCEKCNMISTWFRANISEILSKRWRNLNGWNCVETTYFI